MICKTGVLSFHKNKEERSLLILLLLRTVSSTWSCSLRAGPEIFEKYTIS